MAGTEQQFAVVLDGQVISAPNFEGRIPDGNAQITGNFNKTSAESLATSLKFGALPISFEKDGTQVEEIGPSLAGNQLQAGLTAGLLGLLLVMLYCLVYYRGLGLVVLASLLTAAAITYGMVLLLGNTAGFTLTLPGIAGLIIGVGVTADSFIIFFERIRDEMREGKSMRVAVETGWVRAKKTRLAANVVSLLSAGGPLHLRDRRGEGLRFRARPLDAHRPGDPLLVHQADGHAPGTLQVLQRRRRALRSERQHARHRPRRHRR